MTCSIILKPRRQVCLFAFWPFPFSATRHKGRCVCRGVGRWQWGHGRRVCGVCRARSETALQKGAREAARAARRATRSSADQGTNTTARRPAENQTTPEYHRPTTSRKSNYPRHHKTRHNTQTNPSGNNTLLISIITISCTIAPAAKSVMPCSSSVPTIALAVCQAPPNKPLSSMACI